MDYQTTVTHDTDYELDAEWEWYWKSVGEREWEDARALNETIRPYGVTLGDVGSSSQGYYLAYESFDLSDNDPEAMRDRLDELLAALGREFPIGLLAEDPHAFLLSCLDPGSLAAYREGLEAAISLEEDEDDPQAPGWEDVMNYPAQANLEAQLERGLLGWMNSLQWHIDTLSPDPADEFWHELAVERLVNDGLDRGTAEAAFTDWMARQ